MTENPAPALNNKLSAPASVEFTHVEHGPAASPRIEDSQRYSVTASDIIAAGILVLAIAAAITAMMVASAFVLGRVSGPDAVKIISTCVGGSTLAGIVAVLLGRKK